MLSKLEAVNSIIRNLGTTAVTSINVVNPDVQTALAVLDDETRAVQSTGWWFNKMENLGLAIDNQGFVYIPQNVLMIDAKRSVLDVVQRGDRLFNREGNTFIFTEAVTGLTTVLNLEWDDLPFNAREVIRYTAMFQVQSDLEGNAQKMSKIEDRLAGAYLALKKEHMKSRNLNILNNKHVRSILGGGDGATVASGNFLGGFFHG